MSRLFAVCLLLLATMLWGLAFVAQKSAMGSVGPLTYLGTRYLLGGIVVAPVALWEYRRRPGHELGFPRRYWLLSLLLAALLLVGAWFQQVGITLTSVTNSGFLTSLYVLFVPIISFVAFRAKPHPIVFICVPLALLGVFLLNGGGLARFNGGDVLVLCCAVAFAFHVLLLGYLVRLTGLPITVSAISFFGAGAVTLALAFGFESPNLAGLQRAWLEIVYAGVFSTAIAFSLQAVGQRYVPTANAAIILSAESLFAALGAAVLLGERLPAIGYAGAALIFLAIVAVELLPALRRDLGTSV